MKKTILLFLIFSLNLISFSQNKPEEKFLLSNVSENIGLSLVNISDPYLSPITYNGIGIRYSYDNQRFLNLEYLKLSRQNKFSLTAGLALNPAYTSSMMYTGANYQYGIHYHIKPLKDLTVLAGGNVDADFTIKYLSRNSNNPVNCDVSTNLNLSGIALYNFQFIRKNMQLKLSIQSPFIGCMFVPGFGTSYYELFLLNNLTDAIHFSSLHNKRGIQSKLLLNIPFRKSNWQVGASYNGIKYSANNLVFRQEEISFIIGTNFDMITFAGKKGIPPSNFISPF